MAFKEFVGKVNEIIEDLTSLEVVTLHSADNITLNTDIPDGTKKQGDIFVNVRAAIKNAQVVGYSKFQLDGDAINYINSGLGEDAEDLLKAHDDNVANAQAARKAIIESIIGLFQKDTAV